MFDGLQQWLHRLVVAVPEELSVCEFDCHEPNCRMGDWACCRHRMEEAAERCREEGER
jgi:hypothetical protein